ncbi:hypothetical protein ONS95_008656 [Cadophora gregata]|uniref:uncharacterized protein n=1 Tax=Cadophora gregata TaxID=51156 RepID=UPI0026DB34D3|nr:uncharacterized protein ONS95_008656 [Cadophora gregata]KAK0123641.1 hypothetical protein ONS95_008656 [Cadophora gregata]KAK0129983.1 hypothetical protein ONS96_000523 [Cadophora gregata f. sp. sojae]
MGTWGRGDLSGVDMSFCGGESDRGGLEGREFRLIPFENPDSDDIGFLLEPFQDDLFVCERGRFGCRHDRGAIRTPAFLHRLATNCSPLNHEPHRCCQRTGSNASVASHCTSRTGSNPRQVEPPDSGSSRQAREWAAPKAPSTSSDLPEDCHFR